MDSQPEKTQQQVEQELQAQLLTGVQGNQKQQGKIRDQLREMFNPDDYVTIANPFNHVTGWAYVDPAEEKNERPDKTTKRTTFGKPKTRILQPGQQVVIHGWEAYIALGRMFKEYAQSQGGNMIIVLTSQKEIEAFLGKAFKGVFDPNAQVDAINAQAVAKDIEANTPAPAAPAADPLGFGAPEQPAPAPQTQEQRQEVAAQEVVDEDEQRGSVVPPVVQDDENVSQTPPADTTGDQNGNDENSQVTQ